jgi:hypothetical protein
MFLVLRLAFHTVDLDEHVNSHVDLLCCARYVDGEGSPAE